jgi:hypothetical protein
MRKSVGRAILITISLRFMRPGSTAPARVRTLIPPIVLLLIVAAGCSGALKKDYEYEEELYLGLDGSATLNAAASCTSASK